MLKFFQKEFGLTDKEAAVDPVELYLQAQYSKYWNLNITKDP